MSTFRLSDEEIAELEEAISDADSSQAEFDHAESNVNSAIERYLREHSSHRSNVDAVRAILDKHVTKFRALYNERPGSWAEGERGVAVSEWIESLDEFRKDMQRLVDRLDDILLPEDAGTVVVELDLSIDDIPQEP